MPEINKKRIAHNTLLLYFRMILIMAINFYAVRLVLNILGEEDYGIYNVVGGIVAMFTFISSTMGGAAQRFFSFELGKKNKNHLKQIFSLNVTVFFLIVLIVLILAETIGLWFLNHKLIIPPERMVAAQWVYQFSIIGFVFTIFSIPYTAAITAHEKMNAYAYISMVEVVFRLLILFMLSSFQFDKLKLYAVLMSIISLLVALFYYLYCRFHFEECKFRFYWEKSLFKELASYAGWSIFGSLAFVVRSQGINILISMFFAPAVNAARAVAYQVFVGISQFASNFFTAVRPQLVKSYAVGEKKEMMKLVFQSSRFSFYLLLVIATPLFLEMDMILTLWLKQLPEYVIVFTRLVVINALVESLSNPLIATVQATGKVKQYQIIVSSVLLLNLPISYFFLRCGFSPEVTMVVAIIISILAHTVRVVLVQNLIEMSVKEYLLKVIAPCLWVTALSALFPLLLFLLMPASLLRLGVMVGLSFLASFLTIFFTGISCHERKSLVQFVKCKI